MWLGCPITPLGINDYLSLQLHYLLTQSQSYQATGQRDIWEHNKVGIILSANTAPLSSSHILTHSIFYIDLHCTISFSHSFCQGFTNNIKSTYVNIPVLGAIHFCIPIGGVSIAWSKPIKKDLLCWKPGVACSRFVMSEMPIISRFQWIISLTALHLKSQSSYLSL